MKKHNFVLTLIAFLFISVNSLCAQHFKSLSHITFQTELSENSYVQFKFLLKEGNDSIFIDWGNGEFGHYYVDKKNAETLYKAPVRGKNIEIYGEAEVIRLSNAELTNITFHPGNTLEELETNFNHITSIDLNNATQLKSLWISNNRLTSINTAPCTLLKSLSVTGNKMTALDVSNNTLLKYLYCGENMDDDSYEGIFNLDISMLPLLEELNCSGNSLTTIDLSKNNDLKRFYCSDNYSLNKLIIGNKPALLDLYAANCGLTQIDLLKCAKLQTLVLNSNKLTQLNLTNLSELSELWISTNNFDACALDQIYSQLPKLNKRPDIDNLINEECGPEKRPSQRTATALSKTALAVQKNWRPTSIGDGTGCPNVITLDISQASKIKYEIKVSSGTITLDKGDGNPTLFTPTDNAIVLDEEAAGQKIVLTGNITELIAPLSGIISINTNLNADLEKLVINSNYLSQLDLSNNPALTFLNIGHNHFETINTSNLKVLTTLIANDNNLKTLNLNQNTALTSVNINNNTLSPYNLDYIYSTLPVVTGKHELNNGGDNLFATSATSIARTKGWTVSNVGDGTGCNRQGNITFTTELKKGKQLNFTIQAASNSLVTIDLGNNSSLPLKLKTGTNDFTAPICVDNAQLTLNGPITSLSINDAKISSIDITGNKQLTTLNLSTNALSGDLNIGTATQLEILILGYNPISSIDCSQFPNLQYLNAIDNKFKTLDVSSLTNLSELYVSKNTLSQLNLNKNSKLTKLVANELNLTQIDLSHNPLLKTLFITDNKLVDIDLHLNTALETLYLEYNPLTSLKLKKNIALNKLSIRGVPLDACALDALYRSLPTLSPAATKNNLINEDNYTNASTSHTEIATDKGWLLQTNGDGTGCTEIGEPAATITFATIENDVKIGTGGAKGTSFQIDWGDGVLEAHNDAAFITKKPSNITVKIYGDNVQTLRIANQGVVAVNIENASELETIMCGKNTIKSLNVSENEKLVGIYCSENQISNLDLSHNAALKVIDCHSNLIAGTLDCSNMTDLSGFNCSENKIDKLLLPTALGLKDMSCSGNMLTSLNVSILSNLEELSCSNNQLSSLILKQNTKLIKLYAYGNKFTTLDLQYNLALTNLSISDNEIVNLDISKNAALKGLYVQNNKLEEIDLSQNANLNWINIAFNELSDLELANQSKLTLLNAEHNQLSHINISMSPNIYTLRIGNNQLTDLNLTKNKSVIWLSCDSNKLTTLDLSLNKSISWLEIEKNQLTKLDITTLTNLQRFFAQENKLSEIQLNGAKLQGLRLQNNALPVEQINAIINQLSDVSAVDINDNNRTWVKELNIKGNPNNATTTFGKAEQLGWTVYRDNGVALETTILEGFYYDQRNQLVYTPSTLNYIYIYNCKGLSWKLNHNGKSSLKELPKGIYVVHYIVNNKWYNTKIIK